MNTRSTQKGFTFVETIVVLAIFSFLSLAIINSVVSFYKFNGYAVAQSYQIQNARRGMEVLIRDIREMAYADDGTFPLAEMTDHRISFYSDIDRDDSVEFIIYEVASTTLEKRVYNATGTPPSYSTTTADELFTLSEYVQNLSQGSTTFAYYDVNGLLATSTTNITDIRYIEAQIIVNIDPVRNPGEFLLRSSAALRNLKDNL